MRRAIHSLAFSGCLHEKSTKMIADSESTWKTGLKIFSKSVHSVGPSGMPYPAPSFIVGSFLPTFYLYSGYNHKYVHVTFAVKVLRACEYDSHRLNLLNDMWFHGLYSAMNRLSLWRYSARSQGNAGLSFSTLPRLPPTKCLQAVIQLSLWGQF